MTARDTGIDAAERVLIELVSTPSVSGNERAAAEVFVRHAKALGFETEIDAVGNAHAHRGLAGAPVHIVMLGHIDTVPGEIPVRVEDGVLHGRGSVDAKGPLAAMLLGAARADLPETVRVTVVGAVGEETPDSVGARHLIDRYRPDACFIGEPSGADGVTLGYKGRLVVSATSERENTHSAGPDNSACDDLFAWWSGVLAYVEASAEARTRTFDRIQASVRSASSREDGLSQRASMEAGFRLPPGVDPYELAARLTAMAPEPVLLDWTGHESAAVSDRNDPVARALSAGIRSGGARPRPKLKTGTADFNVVDPHWRCPIAAYGPGDSSLDHTPHERLALDEYHRAIGVLTHALGMLGAELADGAGGASAVGSGVDSETEAGSRGDS